MTIVDVINYADSVVQAKHLRNEQLKEAMRITEKQIVLALNEDAKDVRLNKEIVMSLLEIYFKFKIILFDRMGTEVQPALELQRKIAELKEEKQNDL